MKKTLVLVVALLMTVCMATTVLADVPSKTTSDVAQVVEVKQADGTVIEGLSVAPVADAEPVVEEIKKLYEAVVNQEVAPAQYFPEETQQAIAELLPEVDVSSLELNEFITVAKTGAHEGIESAQVTYNLSTKYSVDDQLVAVVGAYSGEKDAATGEYLVDWYVLEAAAQEDGSVTVNMSKEVLDAMDSANTVALAVLNAAA